MAQTRLPHLFIIEGIPGSGKNTLAKSLLSVLHSDLKPIYYDPENAVGFSYNHMYWPGITNARLTLMESALDFGEEEVKRHSQALFVFNRFHLSLAASLEQNWHDAKVL